MPVICIRLKEETVATLKKMAAVDGMDIEERLSEVVETLVELSQEG